MLKSIWSHKRDLSDEIKQTLIDENKVLQRKLLTKENFQEKLALTEKLIQISGKLKNEENFIQFQKEAKLIKDEINERKLKLKYYLERAKAALSYTLDNLGMKSLKEGDYKDAYLNLYSFSTKLKNITDTDTYQKYQNYAKALINKDQITADELSQVISNILTMKDDIDEYIN